MGTLYLHIGMGKTGSSFLQAILANSHASLLAKGFDYYQGCAGPALEWQISSGNGAALLTTNPEDFAFQADNVIFSMESLFGHFSTNPFFPAKIKALCQAHGLTAVRMLLLIRNPVGHAESCFQQDVKRLGSLQTVEEYFDGYRMPDYVNSLLTRKFDLPDCRIEVANYDQHKDDLTEVLAGFLDLPADIFACGPDRPVNRSMSRAELVLQQRLNTSLGNSAAFLSNALCNGLPEIAADHVFPAVEVQQALLDRMRPAMLAVNARIPADEAYQDDLRNEVSAPLLEVTPEWLDFVAGIFGDKLVALTDETLLLRANSKVTNALRVLERGEQDTAGRVIKSARQLMSEIRQPDVFGERWQRAMARLDRIEARIGATVKKKSD